MKTGRRRNSIGVAADLLSALLVLFPLESLSDLRGPRPFYSTRVNMKIG